MKKVTDFIINKRYIILTIFIILSITSLILASKVNINSDIAKYLPDTSETRIGMDIMEGKFKELKESTFNIMFKGLENEQKVKIYEELKQVEGITQINYDETEEYNKEDYTLYGITVGDKEDSEKASKVYDEITKKYEDYEIYTNGAIAEQNMEVLPIWIVGLAVICVLVILIIMSESYIEPFLFLTVILVAVLLNNGSNIIFGTVSNITSSISAILQLALSMDYSIMLMNRYSQEKEKEKDKIKAMKNALYNAFTSISSSSLTTIVGLITLVFMSFKIGKDLGLVLAKGVLFSLISIFFVLPALILIFDKQITKTKKRTPKINLEKLGKISYKMRPISIFLFIGVFVISWFLKGNLGILYTDSEEDKISDIFGKNNQLAIIYKNENEEEVSQYLKEIEEKEEVEQVLGYGNTINEKLTYNQVVEKLQDLGSDVTIDNYLLKILYYKYYNKEENNQMTFDEFVSFIKSEVYKNEKINNKLDDETRKNIDKLENFTSEASINKKIGANEIANTLGIEKEKVEDILIYYNSKNNHITLNINEFITFMNKDVLTNPKYAKNVDIKARESLNKLSKFTNKSTIQRKMTSKEMANLFGMNENTMNDLYTYYISINPIDKKMTLEEFANFVLTDVATNNKYSSSINPEILNSIKMLQSFSNRQNIIKNMNSKELSSLFGIDENLVKQLLLLKMGSGETGEKYSISSFINNTIYLKNNTHYLNNVDISNLEKLLIFAKNPNNINITKMNKQKLSSIFDQVGGTGFVTNVYKFVNLPEDCEMTPQEFIKMVINTPNIDEKVKSNLQLLEKVIDDSTSKNPTTYTATQMAKNLNIDANKVYQIYALIDFATNNTNNWKISPNNFVAFILENSSNNEQIKNNMNIETINKLKLVSNIMSSALNNTKYSYQELSTFIGVNNDVTKSIYTLYVSKNLSTKLTPQEFVNFVLHHKNDPILANNINANTKNELTLLQTAMNSVLNNKKYTSKELSSLLGIDKSKLDLLYGLYTSKYITPNQTISLKGFINFLTNDVLQNPEYAGNFNQETKKQLNTIKSIMNNINKKYTKDEIFVVLSDFTDIIDKNTVELLYLYYGSSKEYKDEWTMTVEKMINFLNDDIINDPRFTDFIEQDMKQNIQDSKQTVIDAKELLVGNDYSRIVINTKLEPESEQTFNFIQELKDKLSDNKQIKEFYVIGNSPMAYEISQSFGSELDFITIITMIAIFIVVAITFRSLTVPLILVFTIQCAVYMTMGILSVQGEGVHFIALLIVQSILMGATIDYAILYASYYIENRKTMNIKEAIITSYNKSIHTILTSASILVIATLIVGNFASAIAAKICKTISAGTLCSSILILVLLPSMLAKCDKVILRNIKK